MRNETITLGGRQYTLQEMPVKPARAWRESLKAQFGGFITLVEGAPDVEVTNTKAVGGLLRVLSGVLLDSVDLALELLIQFSPELQRDREYIEDNAVGSQVVDGFLAAVGLSFPFFGGERIQKMTHTIQQIGLRNKAT